MIAMTRLATSLALVLSGACLAQSGMDPNVLTLARIKLKMSETLTRLPNYTCTQTIERSTRRAGSRRFQLLDSMRLEVALVEGKELFAWPGARRFEEREIKEFAPPGGAIGNGNFGLHARAVFMGRSPVFAFAGVENRDGRAMVRFDYSVAQVLSGFEVRVGAAKAVVGYHGSFWADEKSHEVARLEVYGDDIPPHLGLKDVSDTVDYARLRIGESDFLLPVSSEMSMTDIQGNENRNRIHFSGCRHYSGESVVSFDEPPPDTPAAPPAAPRVIELPVDLPVSVELITPIDSRRMMMGDRVTAALDKDAKWKGQTVAPRGAVLSGRLTRLERRTGLSGRSQVSYFVVGIEFDTLEFETSRAEFFGSLDEIGPMLVPGTQNEMSRPAVLGRGWSHKPDAGELRPGVGQFVVKGDTIRLARGFRMSWRVAERTRR